MSEILKKEFSREEYFEKYINDPNALETFLKGIPIRADVTSEKVVQEYIPVFEFEYYIDVWNCVPSLAKRIHTSPNSLKTEIIEIKDEKAQELFGQLVAERDVMINMSGHYYIETEKQKEILDQILKIEGLR